MSEVAAGAAGTAITIASYNIRKAVGADRRRRPERILDVLGEIGADIAVLQEADRRFGARHAALPAELVAHYGWRAVPLGARQNSIGWHGNAVLVTGRVDIVRHATIKLPVVEPRGAVMVDMAVEGLPLRIVGMHLDLSGLRRRQQARAILDRLAADGEMPTLLMGDLNEWRAGAGVIADFAATHKVVHVGPSFPARMPLGQLDRIFTSNEMVIEDAGVHRSAQASLASDHLPAWVRVQL